MKKKLLKRHRHNGKWHEPGAEIELRPDQIERLAKAGKVDAGGKPSLKSVDNPNKKGD